MELQWEGQAMGWLQNPKDPVVLNLNLAVQSVMKVCLSSRKAVHILFSSVSIYFITFNI